MSRYVKISTIGAGVTLFDPGNIGYVLITSETGGVSAADMLNEFGIEELDDYFARSLATHMDSRNRDTDD